MKPLKISLEQPLVAHARGYSSIFLTTEAL